MSTGFKYVYNSLHEQSFRSSGSLSCEGYTLVARQHWCLTLRFCCKRVGALLGSSGPFGVEALGLTRDKFHSDGCLSGATAERPCRPGRHATSVFSSRGPSKDSKSKIQCVSEELRGRWDRFISLQCFCCPAKQILGEVCEVFSRQTQRDAESSSTAGLAGGAVCHSMPARSLSLSLNAYTSYPF